MIVSYMGVSLIAKNVFHPLNWVVGLSVPLYFSCSYPRAYTLLGEELWLYTGGHAFSTTACLDQLPPSS